MAQPPPYSPQTIFLSYQAQQAWFPGQNLDVEFNGIDASIAAIEANLALIQRDDGELADGSVDFPQLSTNLATALTNAGVAVPISTVLTQSNTWTKTQQFSAGIGVGTSLYPTIVSPIVTVATSTSSSSPNITVPLSVAGQLFPGQNAFSAQITGGANATIIGVSGTTVTLDMNAAGVFTNSAITFGLQRYDLTSTLITNTLGAREGLFGVAAVGNGNWVGLYDGPSRFSTSGGTAPGISALQAVSANGGRAATFYSRSSDSVGSGVRGVETVVAVGVLDDNPSGPFISQTMYLEGNVLASASPPSWIGAGYLLVEADLASLWTTAKADPYSINNTAHTSVLRAAAGKGYGPGSNNITSAFEAVPNGAKFQTALLVADGGIDTTYAATTGMQTGTGYGALFPQNVGLGWFSAANTGLAQIYANISTFPFMHFNIATNGTFQFDFNSIGALGINSATLFPLANNAFTLGGSSLRWANVYSVLGNFSGTITGPDTGTWSASGLAAGASISVPAASSISWVGRALMTSPADGIVLLQNNAGTGFTRVELGGTSASFPAIKRNGTALNFRLADDSGDAGITAASLGVGANQVVGARQTGWTVMTGTPQRGTFTTGGVTLAQLAGVVMALEQDLITHGLIGT